MIFKDEVSIEVKAGNGGAGAATFRREKYVPRGGPDGGDGGKGGDIVIKVNPHLRTLSHIHNNQKFKAQDGGKGGSNKKSGRKGNSLIIEVPRGTIVVSHDSGDTLADLTEIDSFLLTAKGGIGGKGNVHFKGPSRQTPFYAQKGIPGEIKQINLLLKMIAHVGLVGFPNSGKSTLVSRITNARPKIGNYPFTTLKPNIGILSSDDAYQSLLIADIPGLIEGAHKGKGLGINFLKHIERTGLILFIIDISDSPMEKFQILRNELKSYSESLYYKDFLIALNKIDLLFDNDVKNHIYDDFRKITEDIFMISALTGEGLKGLSNVLLQKYLIIEEKNKTAAKEAAGAGFE